MAKASQVPPAVANSPFQGIRAALQANDAAALMDALHALGSVDGEDMRRTLKQRGDQDETPLSAKESYALYGFIVAWADPGLHQRGLLANAHLSEGVKNDIDLGLDYFLKFTNRKNELIQTVFNKFDNLPGFAGNEVAQLALRKHIIAKDNHKNTDAISHYIPPTRKGRDLGIKASAGVLAIASGVVVGSSILAMLAMMTGLAAGAPVTLPILLVAVAVTAVVSWNAYAGIKNKLHATFFKGHGFFQFRDKNTGEIRDVNHKTRFAVILAAIPSFALAAIFAASTFSSVIPVLTPLLLLVGVSGPFAPIVAGVLAFSILLAYTYVMTNTLANTFKHSNYWERIKKRLDTIFTDKSPGTQALMIVGLVLAVAVVGVLLFVLYKFGGQSLADTLIDKALGVPDAIAHVIAGVAGVLAAIAVLPKFLPILSRAVVSLFKDVKSGKALETAKNISWPKVGRFVAKSLGAIIFRIPLTILATAVNIVLHMPIVHYIPELFFKAKDYLSLKWMKSQSSDKKLQVIKALEDHKLDPLQFSIKTGADGNVTVEVPNWSPTPAPFGQRLSHAFTKIMNAWLPWPTKTSTRTQSVQAQGMAEAKSEARLGTTGGAAVGWTQATMAALHSTGHVTNAAAGTTAIGIGVLAAASAVVMAESVNRDAGREVRELLMLRNNQLMPEDLQIIREKCSEAAGRLLRGTQHAKSNVGDNHGVISAARIAANVGFFCDRRTNTKGDGKKDSLPQQPTNGQGRGFGG